jgi:hypothetical protein
MCWKHVERPCLGPGKLWLLLLTASSFINPPIPCDLTLKLCSRKNWRVDVTYLGTMRPGLELLITVRPEYLAFCLKPRRTYHELTYTSDETAETIRYVR